MKPQEEAPPTPPSQAEAMTAQPAGSQPQPGENPVTEIPNAAQAAEDDKKAKTGETPVADPPVPAAGITEVETAPPTAPAGKIRSSLPLDGRTLFRKALAVFSLIIFLAIAFFTAYQYLRTSKYLNPENRVYIPDRPFNDMTGGSIQVKVNLSSNLFQVGLLVAAGLGGLLIAKKEERDLVTASEPEIIMLTCAGLLILSTFIYHALYLNEIAYAYYVAGGIKDNEPSMPDIFDPNIDYLVTYQLWYLVTGVLIAALTFISAHKIRRIKKP